MQSNPLDVRPPLCKRKLVGLKLVAGEEVEEDLEEEEPNIEEYMAKIWRQFGIWEDDPNYDNKPP
jgi:hypothetical protein